MTEPLWDMCLVCRGDHKTRDHTPTLVDIAIKEERERIARKIEEMTFIEGNGEWDSTYSAEPGVSVKPLLEWLRR